MIIYIESYKRKYKTSHWEGQMDSFDVFDHGTD